jgi:DNA-binding XRE family transcriptional regulator
MDEQTRNRLEGAGRKVGSVEDFLGLSEAELAYIDMRLALSRALKRRRQAAGMSQQALARRLGSSQPRVSKMESGDPSVTLDLRVRALLETGATPDEIGQALIAKPAPDPLRRAS